MKSVENIIKDKSTIKINTNKFLFIEDNQIGLLVLELTGTEFFRLYGDAIKD
jgi:hypothetical protein